MKKPIALELLPGRWINIAYKESTTNGDAEGEYFHSDGEGQIEMMKSLTPQMSFSTMIHELTHAGFDLSGQDQLFTRKQEEAICKMNEMIFSHLFTLNKSKHIKWAEIDKEDD